MTDFIHLLITEIPQLLWLLVKVRESNKEMTQDFPNISE